MIDKNQTSVTLKPRLAILNLAFRPLFLLGVLFSVLAMSFWVYFWLKPFPWSVYGGPVWWHGHEMLFGFGIAIVSGFLLTAVKTWTGVPGLSGTKLALFVLVWLTSRILILTGSHHLSHIIALIDVSFLLLSAIALAYPIIKVKQWRNLMFVPILLMLASLNAYSHWSVLTNHAHLSIQSLHATAMLFVLMIAILGGRVIPFFTANATTVNKPSPIKSLEIISLLSIFSMAIIAFLGFDQVNHQVLLSLSAVAAISNVARWLRWGWQKTFTNPLLWSLHVSFLFIPFGFILMALYAVNLIDSLSVVIHCFTVGSIGGMILAMISRVTLGHTGRPLKSHILISSAFSLILISAIIRVVIPAWFINYYQTGIIVAGILWIVAFAFYLLVYSPMLLNKRADGKEG